MTEILNVWDEFSHLFVGNIYLEQRLGVSGLGLRLGLRLGFGAVQCA